MIESALIGLAAKTLLVVLVITICISAVVFYYREYQKQKESNHEGKEGLVDFNGKQGGQAGPAGIKYVLWIGDAATTLDVLALAQQGATIQPIYIPDPTNSLARTEYELQITRTLRVRINTKYPQSQVMPIISITRQQPDDQAFNLEYDMTCGSRDELTRENILQRWAKYYKFIVAGPRVKTNARKGNKKNGDGRILAETWNCRFPIGTNGVPCGLCKKCEKLNTIN